MKFAVLDFSLNNGFSEIIVKALEYNNINHNVLRVDNSEQVINDLLLGGYTHAILRAPCDIGERKTICDELAYSLEHFTKIKIFPKYNELLIYENKKYLSMVLSMNNIPHPKTVVYYDSSSAKKYIKKADLPIVIKMNIGASSSGVNVINKKKVALKYVNNSFGIIHSYLAKGNAPIKKKFGLKFLEKGRAERHYIIMQEYIEFKWEWRVIKNNDQYLAYKKLKGANGFASGSGVFGYELPPNDLLELTENICKKLDLNSVAIDFFETEDKGFLVNEIQCLFGAKPIVGHLSSQMINEDGHAVYYKRVDGKFDLIKGEICLFECWDMRIKGIIK